MAGLVPAIHPLPRRNLDARLISFADGEKIFLEKYNRFTMKNARQLQCKALREHEKSRQRKNNGKQWKNQCAEQSEQSDIRAPACGCNANTNARPPLPAPGRAKFFDWRMFLSANRRPLRRNMRSQKSETSLGFQPSPILRANASKRKKRSRYPRLARTERVK